MRLLFILLLGLSAYAQTITWTKKWPTGVGPFNAPNGYQDIAYDSYTNRTWIYSTSDSNNGTAIYSSRLHHFVNGSSPSDTTIGDNGQTSTMGCVPSSSTWPGSHHAVGQFWFDSVRNRVWSFQGVGCLRIQYQMWYYQISNPPDSHTNWVEVQPPTMPFDSRGFSTEQSTLSVALNIGDTQMSVANPCGYATGDYVKIDTEIVKVTAGSSWTGASSSSSPACNGTNPLTIARHQFGTTEANHNSGVTAAGIMGEYMNARVVHDSYHDVFFLFGQKNSTSYGALLAYCPTSAGTLSAAQTSVGCTVADDWNNITSKSICAGSDCTLATTGTNGANSGKLPHGWYYPSMDYDSKNHQLVTWGGTYGDASTGPRYYAFTYNPETYTWTQLTTTCTGADCSGNAPTIRKVNSDSVRFAHAMDNNGKYYYHLAKWSGGANTQDWVLDVATGAWTEIQTNQGPNYTETMVFDSIAGALVSWGYTNTTDTAAEVWVGSIGGIGTVPTINNAAGTITAGTQGIAYTYTFTATGSPSPTWTSTALPTGLSLDTNTGVLSGTPTQAGTYTFDVTATNSVGSDTHTYSLVIGAVYNNSSFGYSTPSCVDVDGDGYGAGSGCLAADPDDTDASVKTYADVISKYGNLGAFWSHMGWTPTNVLYVDGGTGTCTAVATPFAYDSTKGCGTISAAITAQGTNDAVVLKSGTYSQGSTALLIKNGALTADKSSCTGTAYYLAYPGDTPVVSFTGDGIKVGYTYTQGVNGCIWLDGWRVTGAATGVGRSFGQVNRVAMYKYTLSHMDISGFSANVFTQYWQMGTKILHNYIHDAYPGGDEGHNIYLGSNEFGSTGTIIQGNVIARSYDSGIHINGPQSNVTVDSNLVFACGKCLAFQNGYHNSTISNNVVHTNRTRAIELYEYANGYTTNNLDAGGNPTQCTDITGLKFINNSIYATNKNYTPFTSINPTAGSSLVYMVDPGSCQTEAGFTPLIGNNTFQNNIFVRSCGGDTNCVDSGNTGTAYVAPVIRYNTTRWADGLNSDIWKNNIILNVDMPSRILSAHTYNASTPLTGETVYDCTWFSNTANVPYASGNQCNVDPKYTSVDPLWNNSPSSYDLRLQSSSPAIGTGYSTDSPTLDIIGATRSTPITVGAYQYVSPVSSSVTTLKRGSVQRGSVK